MGMKITRRKRNEKYLAGLGMVGAAISNGVIGKAAPRRFFSNILREKRGGSF